MQYFKPYSNGIVCNICEHFCFLAENEIGLCHNQQNQQGALITLSEAKPYALNITHIEQRPFYHVKPSSLALCLGTLGCNLHCPHCQNHMLTQPTTQLDALSLEAEEVVKLALEHDCASISYSYNDAVVFYPYAKEIGIIAKNKGLLNLFHTAGYASQMTNEDMLSWVDALHVDLKSMNASYYKSVLGASLSSIKESLRFYAKSSMHLEITTLLIDGVNCSDEELEEMAHFIAKLGVDIPWHLSAFSPAHNASHLQSTSTDTLLRAFEIAKKAKLNYVYFGNVPWLNETFCSTCKERIVLRKEYELFENKIIKGECSNCHGKISGIW